MTTHHPAALPCGSKPRQSYDDPLTPGQLEWTVLFVKETADASASGVAKGFVRLGVAHRLLCLAHLAAMIDHQGRDATVAWLDLQIESYCARGAELRRG